MTVDILSQCVTGDKAAVMTAVFYHLVPDQVVDVHIRGRGSEFGYSSLEEYRQYQDAVVDECSKETVAAVREFLENRSGNNCYFYFDRSGNLTTICV